MTRPEVVVPVVTLFHSDGSIDFDSTAALIERLIGAGVDSLLFLGSTGEAQHLTFDERVDLLRWACGRFRSRITTYVGIGDLSTSVACHLAKEAEVSGAGGVVALAPWYWPIDDRHLKAYFGALASATGLPLLLYNYPGIVGADLSPELVRCLAEEYPTITGIKETLDSGTHIRRMIHEVRVVRTDFRVYCGHDDLALFALEAGADGMVSSTANFAPELMTGLRDAWSQGDAAEGVNMSARIGRLVELYRLSPFGPAVVKAALHARDWIADPAVRPPALPLGSCEATHVGEILRLALELGE